MSRTRESQGLDTELLRLRRCAPILTNQVIARRASALASPLDGWRVTGQRLGEWLAGKSVPHRLEALLAVVTVLTEHIWAEAARTGESPTNVKRRPDVQRWTALWTAARAQTAARDEPELVPVTQAPVTQAPPESDRSQGGGQPPGSLLGPRMSDPRLVHYADQLAEEVCHDVAAMAGDLTLLSPPPMDIQWKPMVGPVDRPRNRRDLFPALPLGERPHGEGSGAAAESRGRAGLLAAYADRGNGRLVVLGDPGSGKTSAALLLVMDAIAERNLGDRDERATVPVPVYLRLFTWDPLEIDLDDWIVAELGRSLPRYAHGPGRAALRELLDGGLISLVLDGVDEMPEVIRRQAVETLLRRTRSRLVVLGRPDDFCAQDASELLAGATAVRLQPVAPDHAAAYLHGCGCRIDPTASKRSPQEHQLLTALTTPLAVALARDEWTAATTAMTAAMVPDAHAPEAAQNWLAAAAIRRAFAGPGWSRNRALAGVSLIARRMTAFNVSEFDWWTLPSFLVRRRGLATAAGITVAAVVVLAHGSLAVLHHQASDQTFSFAWPCPDMTWKGRLAHDLGSMFGQAIGLSLVAAGLVTLRLPVLPARPDAPRAPTMLRLLPASVRGPARIRWWALPGCVLVGAVTGATAAAGLSAIMSKSLRLGTQIADNYTCRIAPSVQPWELLDVAVQGSILAGLFTLAVLSYVWAAHHRSLAHRSGRGVGALYRDLWRTVMACGLSGAVLSLALIRRTTGDGFMAPFLPKDTLSERDKRWIGAADGAVTGLEVGLAVGLGLALVTAVIIGSSALQADNHRTQTRWRWAPAAPVRRGAVVVVLAGGSACMALTLRSLDAGQSPSLLASLALPAGAAWVLLRPRGTPITRCEPGSVLTADGRFALATVAAAVLFSMPFSVYLIYAPELGVTFPDVASGVRLTVCILVTALVGAGLFTSAVTALPLLRAVQAYLRLAGHPVDLRRAVTTAYRGGLVRAVGPRYQFRHRNFQEFLAEDAHDGGPPSTFEPAGGDPLDVRALEHEEYQDDRDDHEGGIGVEPAPVRRGAVEVPEPERQRR